MYAPLASPFLALAADILDDTEKVRIANENRLRQLTRTGPDADGTERGFGLDLSHPAVARLAAMVKTMKCDSKVVTSLTGEKNRKSDGCCLEHDAERNLVKVFADHALSPWMEAQKGVGAKQGGRLLGAIGDPYMRPELVRKDKDGEVISVEPARPRLVSELWSYCGLSVTKVPVGDRKEGDAGQYWNGTHEPFAGVAPRRQRGQRGGWSAVAKMRVYLVAESCVKQMESPYRKFYDRGRERWVEAMHEVACSRCGPKGNPAPAGSPLMDAHKHARAMRLVMKEILRDLWTEAKRLHGDR